MSLDLVILDRDGVINHSPIIPNRYITHANELIYFQDVFPFLVLAHRTGVPVVVATNQQCVGLELLTIEDLNLIHAKISAFFRCDSSELLSKFYVCPHIASNGCSCRKPRPGLILRAISDYFASPSRTLFIGDSISDYQAALASGVDFRLLVRGQSESHTDLGVFGGKIVSSLSEIEI